MYSESDFLDYLKKEGLKTFQTKGMSEHLKQERNIPKSNVRLWVSILKTNGLIVRKSKIGNCQTTCASCYEYGCDVGQRPPVNFWELINPTDNK